MKKTFCHPAILLMTISTVLWSPNSLAYSCAIIGIPSIVYHSENIYPNTRFLINNWVLYDQLQTEQETLSADDLKQMKPLFYLLNTNSQTIPYTYRAMNAEYSWAQPNQNLQANQKYTLDLSPLLSYAHEFSHRETQVHFPFNVQGQNFKAPQNISNKPTFNFISSQFADDASFGNGGFHEMKIDLISNYNLNDYLLLLNLKNYTQKFETHFIIKDITWHSAQHVTLTFTNDVCGQNLDFYKNEKWSITVDLISPDGQIIKQANEAYVFNTSSGGELSFWAKFKKWWQSFKLNWL